MAPGLLVEIHGEKFHVDDEVEMVLPPCDRLRCIIFGELVACLDVFIRQHRLLSHTMPFCAGLLEQMLHHHPRRNLHTSTLSQHGGSDLILPSCLLNQIVQRATLAFVNVLAGSRRPFSTPFFHLPLGLLLRYLSIDDLLRPRRFAIIEGAMASPSSNRHCRIYEIS